MNKPHIDTQDQQKMPKFILNFVHIQVYRYMLLLIITNTHGKEKITSFNNGIASEKVKFQPIPVRVTI